MLWLAGQSLMSSSQTSHTRRALFISTATRRSEHYMSAACVMPSTVRFALSSECRPFLCCMRCMFRGLPHVAQIGVRHTPRSSIHAWPPCSARFWQSRHEHMPRCRSSCPAPADRCCYRPCSTRARQTEVSQARRPSFLSSSHVLWPVIVSEKELHVISTCVHLNN